MGTRRGGFGVALRAQTTGPRHPLREHSQSRALGVPLAADAHADARRPLHRRRSVVEFTAANAKGRPEHSPVVSRVKVSCDGRRPRETLTRHNSTCVPNSTTRFVGTWKNSDAFVAFFDNETKSFSRHSAIPGVTVAISVSRDTKNDVSIMSNAKPFRPQSSSSSGTSGSSLKP